MPIDYKNYPKEFKAISLELRTIRARHICECTGQCGTDHAAEWAEVAPEVKEGYWAAGIIDIPDNRCHAVNGALHHITDSKVVLTCAHICQCRPICAERDHLMALCQKCHNRMDAPSRAINARQTRQRKRIASGALFDYSDNFDRRDSMDTPKKTIRMELAGLDGNAFVLLSAFRSRARAEGWTETEINAVLTEARSGDYDHLLRVLMEYCESPEFDD